MVGERFRKTATWDLKVSTPSSWKLDTSSTNWVCEVAPPGSPSPPVRCCLPRARRAPSPSTWPRAPRCRRLALGARDRRHRPFHETKPQLQLGHHRHALRAAASPRRSQGTPGDTTTRSAVVAALARCAPSPASTSSTGRLSASASSLPSGLRSAATTARARRARNPPPPPPSAPARPRRPLPATSGRPCTRCGTNGPRPTQRNGATRHRAGRGIGSPRKESGSPLPANTSFSVNSSVSRGSVGRCCHRSFSVVIANRAKMNAAIRKR